ncbi:hypothetical protein PHYPSEUDO_002621 [Phytophthora pseudosyringae]|uniref:Uncharacterized protein n=1 Tax=Phytophthora pseudosyringae TaxID=221518 RepID=A0A8T1VWU7_9STRA|nr:hypothetical protein PHYPSEUDO_002621 [Phytophthora pseudosyringae]
MPQEDPDAIAPYDGSSTESEYYDEEPLESAAANTHNGNSVCNSAPQPTTGVKVEALDDDANAPPAVKSEDATATEESKPNTTTTYNKCKRCRRKLPTVSEKEQTDAQQGEIPTKHCACCCEHYPLRKFSMANRKPSRAVPRCRSCTQAPLEVLLNLRKMPEYAKAAAAEMKKLRAERKETRAKLPPFERKTMKQRYEEQFQTVRGKTARERRLAHRNEGKQERLASIRRKRVENKNK